MIKSLKEENNLYITGGEAINIFLKKINLGETCD